MKEFQEKISIIVKDLDWKKEKHDEGVNMNFGFIAMPESRKSDYCLGCLGGSVFIDFDNHNDSICIKRISFDTYGCCQINQGFPMPKGDSMAFKQMYENKQIKQTELEKIIRRTIKENVKFIWKSALVEYRLI